MRFIKFLSIFCFMQVKESKMYQQTKKWAFFTAGIIFNDLMKVQQ
jgi:hypothetical protein